MTGTPGTGKTTIAKILSKKLDARHIELSVYAKENGLILENDEERDTEIVDMDALTGSLDELVKKSNGLVVVEGHYSHELFESEQVLFLFVLRKAPWQLHDILQNRLYSYEKVWENLEAEIVGVIAQESQEYSIDKLHEVDTTDKSATETVEEILDVIRGEKPTSYGPIDWVTYPETLRVLVNRTCTL